MERVDQALELYQDSKRRLEALTDQTPKYANNLDLVVQKFLDASLYDPLLKSATPIYIHAREQEIDPKWMWDLVNSAAFYKIAYPLLEHHSVWEIEWFFNRLPLIDPPLFTAVRYFTDPTLDEHGDSMMAVSLLKDLAKLTRVREMPSSQKLSAIYDWSAENGPLFEQFSFIPAEERRYKLLINKLDKP